MSYAEAVERDLLVAYPVIDIHSFSSTFEICSDFRGGNSFIETLPLSAVFVVPFH